MRLTSDFPDVLVVGAGFAGAVAGRRLADAGHSVRMIDRRPHIGGNAWDETDAHGVLVHPYGPHIFHTNSRRVMAWLSRFTDWRFYEHRVLARVDDRHFPIPINRTTLNAVFGLELEEADVPAFLELIREPRAPLRSSEDVVLNSVGSRLCDMFFRGYTKKQWGRNLSELSSSVAARIPVRTDDDDRYFGDGFQFMPRDGYGAMFARMLDHPRIEIALGQDYASEPSRSTARHTVYTGPIDEFFDYRFGPLPYRSLRFEHYHTDSVGEDGFVQPAPVVNYPNEEEFTRITEFKQLTGQRCAGSSLVREYPSAKGDPYYPIPCAENEALLKQYEAEAMKWPTVSFVGRLAQYRYYNMDQVVASAIKVADSVAERLTSKNPGKQTLP